MNNEELSMSGRSRVDSGREVRGGKQEYWRIAGTRLFHVLNFFLSLFLWVSFCTLNNVNSIQTASERAHLDLTEAFESKERA